LFSLFDLPEALITLLGQCTLLSGHPIPGEVMTRYCSGRGDRQSAASMAEIVSSTQNTSVGGGKQLNRFQYAAISAEVRPAFLTFAFDEGALEVLVKSKFEATSPECSFDDLISDLVEKLTQIRRIVYSIKWVEGVSKTATWSETRIQCMMQLFLNYTLEAWYSGRDVGLVAAAANSDLIEYIVTNPAGEAVKWKGHADIKCSLPDAASLSGIGSQSIYEAAGTFEMKVPFGPSDPRLFHSKALQPKQQLLGQAIGLFRGKPDGRSHTLSYLTDIVAIAVMYYVKGKSYLSERVTGEKEFCLRVLLLCCDLSTTEWSQLLPADADVQPVDLDADTAPPVAQQTGSSSSASTVNESCAGIASRTRGAENRGFGDHKSHAVAYTGTFGDEEEEAHQGRLADITNILRWQSKCKGSRYLGVDEIDQHDASMRAQCQFVKLNEPMQI